jgi:hypothetical protein
MCVAAFIIGLIVITLSGLWPHHGLILMVPISLSLVFFSMAMRGQLSRDNGNVLLATGVAAVLLSGVPSIQAYLDPIVYFRANAAAYFKPSSEAKLIMSTGTPTTYARVGGGNGPDHAFGLDDWTLACPFFTQFTWESSTVLRPTLDCIPKAKVVLVEANLPRATTNPDWNNFVNGVDELLAKRYLCRVVDGAKICRR